MVAIPMAILPSFPFLWPFSRLLIQRQLQRHAQNLRLQRGIRADLVLLLAPELLLRDQRQARKGGLR